MLLQLRTEMRPSQVQNLCSSTCQNMELSSEKTYIYVIYIHYICGYIRSVYIQIHVYTHNSQPESYSLLYI